MLEPFATLAFLAVLWLAARWMLDLLEVDGVRIAPLDACDVRYGSSDQRALPAAGSTGPSPASSPPAMARRRLTRA